MATVVKSMSVLGIEGFCIEVEATTIKGQQELIEAIPANFMLVAAMNPCPCGYYPGNKCRCTDYEIIHYRGKISGPILERIEKKWKPQEKFSRNVSRRKLT